MRIAVYGLGYVGVTAAACLAHDGHEVVGVDVNETKVREVNEGRSPIVEPRVGEMIAKAVAERRLRATGSGSDIINLCDVAMVCVGTPSAPSGAHNLSHIAEVSRQIARSISPSHRAPLTIVYRSTIRPGTTENVILPLFRAALGERVSNVEIVYNPEFLREATAVSDYFSPPKIVVGTADGRPNAHIEALHRKLDAPTFHTKYREAELTKFVDNSFHALKVAFGNEIGRVCLNLGISAAKVHEIFIADTKLNISPRYFRPGGAFGGSCLPKDVRALQHLARETRARTPVIDVLLASNEAHKNFLFQRATAELAPGGSVLLLGLAFKAGSDDLRESPKVHLARRLLDAGYALSIYDPALRPDRLVGQNLAYGFMELPELAELLVPRETAESRVFDIVIDASGLSGELDLASANVLNIAAFA